MPNGTGGGNVIIDFSLNEQAINAAIDSMVNTVDQKMGQFVQVFDTHLSAIEQKLKNLGNIKDTSSQTQKEKEAVKELATSYDQLAAATKKAIDAKGTRQNALSFVSANMQNYRDSLAQITQQLTQAEAALKQAIDNKVAQLNAKIEQDKIKVSELRQELVKLQMQQQKSGNYSMFQPEQLRIQQQIENKMAHIAELQQRINAAPTMMQNSQEAQKVLELRQQQERINQLLGEQQQKISGVTLSLDQQFVKEQQIAEILKSKATAQDAYMRATRMDDKTYDNAVAKLERLKLVQEALNRNPILPESSILRLGRVIDETTQKIQKLESTQQQNAQATSATQNAVQQQAHAIRQTGLSAEESARQVMDAEARKQASVRETGFVAQFTAQQILASMHQQAMLDSDSPIMGIKQLSEAIKQMRAAYYSMGSEQESPIGQALRRDIENAEKARQEVKAYNDMLLSLSSPGMANIASLNELREQIKGIVEQYGWMRKRERESAEGRELVEKFQQLSHSAEQVQKALNRPINLDKALGLSATTLDEINYKMQQLRSYMSGIDFTKQGSDKEIQRVRQELAELEKQKQKLLGTNKQLADSNTWLARSFQYMKNRLAFYFTIGASTQFVKNLIEIRSQYEMTERALGILIDSAERGSQIFNELSSMALQSPFTLIELSNAAKQLTAYDIAAKDVVDTTRRLADMASAVGVNIDRLTYALGQVKAYNYLNARDARMFANAGIPLVKQLADYYTELEGRMVSVGDVYDRMKKKAISFEDTMAVITKMTDEGGKFFDFQAKMAGTLRVQLANLTLAWNNMLNEIGKSNSTILTAPIKALKYLFSAWKQIERVFKDVLWLFGTLGLVRVIAIAIAMLKGFRSESYLVTIAGTRLGTMLSGLKTAFLSLMKSPWTWIILVGTALAELALHSSRAEEAARQLGTAIEQSARESIKSLQKFRKTNEDAIKELNAGILQPDETQKLWENAKEELENSADSAASIIPQLMSIADVGERVQTALDWSKRIDEANIALSDLKGNLIKIGDDVVWGLFGEGIAEDIEDWADSLQKVKKATGAISQINADYKETGEAEEAINEIGKVAEQVANTVETLLGEEGMKDRIKVGEAVARISQQIKLENPKIQGELAKLFDIELDVKLAERWSNVYDDTTTLWKYLMNEVKKDSSSAFQDLSQEWLEGTETMTKEQKKAFDDAAEHLRKTLPPEFHDVLNRMMADLNSRDFRIRVGISFDTRLLDDIQKDFNKHFTGSESGKGKWGGIQLPQFWSKDAMNAEKQRQQRIQTYVRFNKKESESTIAWQKRLTDAYKEQNDNLALQQKRYSQTSGVVQEDAKRQIESSKEILSILKEIGEYEGFDVTGSKNKKGGNKNKSNKSRVKEEDLVAKALKEELSVINEMQSAYDKLRKAGVGTTEALTIASSGYDKTLASINATLSKYGISPFKAEDFVGSSDPHKLLKALQDQLDTLVKSGKVKTASLKDLEMEIKKITVDAREYDMKKITDGLNNELGKIKEEYELAVELEANPELGQLFAESFGIDTTNFPTTVQEAVDMMQDAADKAIAESEFGRGIDIDPEDIMHPFNILHDDIEKWAKQAGQDMESELVDKLRDAQKEARNLVEEDAKQTMQDWQKLLEKYAEYETKKAEIQRQAEQERETARKHGASQEIFDAIDLKELREIEKLNFDEFQKSASWIVATGDLSNLTDKALQMLIDRIWEYKKAAKNLDPKEIIKLNNAMRKLRKEQKKDNPFAAWSIMLDEAKERMEQYQPDIEELERKIKGLLKKQSEQHFMLSDEDNKRLSEYVKELERLRKEQNEVGKLTLGDKLGAIQKYSSAIKEIADSIINIANGFGAKKISQAAEALKDVLGVVDKAKTGYELGGKYGAIAGAVLGITEMLVQWFDGNEDINDQIEYSQRQVKKLENQYKDLQHAMEEAYGAAKYGAQQAMIYNKKLQLEQLEAQLRLEKQRKSKHKDEDAIISLEGQIIDLKNEIKDAINDITQDMLGISSVSDAAESVVKSMIDAFKSGEDYMKVFEDSFEDMIDNMIAKTIVSRLIGDFIQGIFDQIKAKKVENASGIADSLSYAQSVLQGLYDFAEEFGMTDLTQQNINEWEENVKRLQDAYNSAITPTPEDVAELQATIAAGKESIKEGFDAWMSAFGIQFGQNAGAQELSALQQGIQGITEDTAGALEAYMNSVSQQVYLHSDLLTQIRDILINFGGDVTIATNAQILLQLQQSFQVQMTIQNVLTGVLNASGLAFRVELAN